MSTAVRRPDGFTDIIQEVTLIRYVFVLKSPYSNQNYVRTIHLDPISEKLGINVGALAIKDIAITALPTDQIQGLFINDHPIENPDDA